MKKMKNKIKKSGFGALELLLAGSVFVLLLVSIIGLLFYGRDSLDKDNLSSRASLLANEGMAAVDSIRQKDFSGLVDGVHGLFFSGGEWSFLGEFDEKLGFTRRITVSSISETEKKVVVEVTWTKRGGRLGRIVLSKYFTNWTEGSEVQIIEADQLEINTSALSISGSQVDGTLIRNNGPQEIITIKQIQLTWVNIPADIRITSIDINSINVWSGSSDSESILDINFPAGFELDILDDFYTIDFGFNLPVPGIELTVKFIMIDDSEKQINLSDDLDITPPGKINDLDILSVGNFNIDLIWTAPGDDDYVGTATSYEVRYSTSNITEVNWGSATLFSNPPIPSPVGSIETVSVIGLSSATTYYFAIKTIDDAGNISEISNVVFSTTASLPQADYLSVDTSSAYVGSGNPARNNVYDIYLSNNGIQNIILDSIKLAWTGSPASQLREIFINEVSVWSGTVNSDGTAAISGSYILTPGGGPYNMRLRFQHDFTGRTINYIDFNLSDGSIKIVGPINP